MRYDRFEAGGDIMSWANFVNPGGCEIQLLCPLNEDGPLGKRLAKRGEGVHHICFTTPDLEGSVDRLAEAGVELTSARPVAGPPGAVAVVDLRLARHEPRPAGRGRLPLQGGRRQVGAGRGRAGASEDDVAGALDAVGVGLWTMQSTAMAAPADPTALYERLRRGRRAGRAPRVPSVWSAEHRAWYDGWCPALRPRPGVRRGAHRAGALRPRDPARAPARPGAAGARRWPRSTACRAAASTSAPASATATPSSTCSGLRRDRRGRLMDAALDAIAAVWAGERGDAPPVQRPGPPIWIGGMAPQAIARAASRGHGLMLPQTLRPAGAARDHRRLPRAGRVARARWAPCATSGSSPTTPRAAAFRRKVDAHFREEAGSWWVLQGPGRLLAARADGPPARADLRHRGGRPGRRRSPRS